jgi:hypothetical protein
MGRPFASSRFKSDEHRMRILLVSVAVATFCARGAAAQTPVSGSQSVTALGTWRGTSVCLVHPSSCRDEIVVYRITPKSGGDSVAFDARKIVRGQEEEMGVLTCGITPAVSHAVTLTCRIPNALWRFQVRGDSLLGELRLADSTRFRDVHTVRAR